jgi:hypothetical protein
VKFAFLSARVNVALMASLLATTSSEEDRSAFGTSGPLFSPLSCNNPGNLATRENIKMLNKHGVRDKCDESKSWVGQKTVDAKTRAAYNLFDEVTFSKFQSLMDEYISTCELDPAVWEEFFAAFGNKRTCLSRFLTARDGNPNNAAVMMKNTFQFRLENRVSQIVYPGDDRLGLCKRIRDYWTGTFFGVTEDGSPVQYHRVELLRPPLLMGKDVGEDRLRIFYLWWLETCLSMQRVGQELRSSKPAAAGGKSALSDSNIIMPKGIEIFDFKGVSLWYLSGCISGLRMFSRALSVGQDHYPENLRKAFVINAPSIIALLWTVCLYVLSPRTKSKIQLTSDENREGLREFMDDDMITSMFSSTDIYQHSFVDEKHANDPLE